MIRHDQSLWKKDYKLGLLPGEISIASKLRLLKGLSVQGCSTEAAKGFKREVIRKANRKHRHHFKNEELKKLLEELDP